jgi:hypothetical protein
MSRLCLLTMFLLLNNLAFSQGKLDSLQRKANDIQLPQLPDPVKTSWHKVDSIRNDFNHEADSLRTGYEQSIGSIDSQTGNVQHKIDSLNNLNLPSNKFSHKLDSLNQQRTKVESDFNAQTDKLKSKTIGKLDKIEMTPEMEGPVGEFTQKVNGFSVTDNQFVKIPELQVPGYALPKIEDVKGLDGLKGLGGLPKVETPLGNLGDVTKQAEGLGSDIKNISQGNLNGVKAVPDAIEQQAGKMAGVDELQKQTDIANGYKDQLADLNNRDAMKQQGADMAKKEAINHFAGKEEQLKAAMDKMSKYKQKYSSVKSIKDLPKRPPNAMKGKPFIERVVPGLYLQLQVKNDWLVDVNPYLSYKLTGRFVPGLGWNQRFNINRSNSKAPVSRTQIYGPRAFVDFRLGKGFIAHIEQEATNTYVPTTIKRNSDEGKREWVWSTMMGLKKQYKIYKNLNGTVLIQYNLTNHYFKTPYLDRLNSRMGFEYLLFTKKPKN